MPVFHALLLVFKLPNWTSIHQCLIMPIFKHTQINVFELCNTAYEVLLVITTMTFLQREYFKINSSDKMDIITCS